MSRGRTVAAVLLLTLLGFGGCAQQPQQIAATGHSKEYFPSSIYGAASRRVVENGPVPHGGGQYLVGRPYTVAGQTYYPSERKLVQVGNASWYGDAFHGRLTANGEIYDRDSFTAAHPTMPLPSYARVTNLRTNASMIVRVNDRGPFASNRVMDVSRRVAEALDFRRTGTARVKVEYVGRASLAGSDDAKLYATLRTNGPAQWHESEPTMLAEAQPPARVASIAPAVPAPPMSEPLLRRDAMPRHPSEEIAAPTRVRSGSIDEPAPIARHARLDPRGDARPALRWQRGPAPSEDALRMLLQRQAAPRERPTRAFARTEPNPIARPGDRAARPVKMSQAPVPPTRHIDLATIPGADVPIGTLHRNKPGLRLSRND